MRITKARIDRGKLHVALEGLSREQAISLLFDAIALVPDADLAKLFARHLDVKQLGLDDPAKRGLFSQVRAFDAASRAGRYYVGFNVNSKNYMEKSTGTRTFIAECNRLLDRCVARAAKDDPTETTEAFELIFALFKDIDGGRDDIVFFADEGGSWQIGADWIKVLPAWFACLAGTVEPDEYATRVVDIIRARGETRLRDHADSRRTSHLTLNPNGSTSTDPSAGAPASGEVASAMMSVSNTVLTLLKRADLEIERGAADEPNVEPVTLHLELSKRWTFAPPLSILEKAPGFVTPRSRSVRLESGRAV